MKNLFLFISITVFALSVFSQKITISEFDSQNWINVYEDTELVISYKYEDGTRENGKGRKYIIFKINNITNAEIIINPIIVTEYNNLQQSFTNNAEFRIAPNSELTGSSKGDNNIRIPFCKYKDSEYNIKLIKIDF